MWLGETALSDAALGTRPTQDTERWCNQVAAEFLLPLEAVQDAYRRDVDMTEARGDGSTGGDFYNTQPVRVSKRFARALVTSTLEGRTLYTEAFEMLGFGKQSTFNELATRLGVG